MTFQEQALRLSREEVVKVLVENDANLKALELLETEKGTLTITVNTLTEKLTEAETQLAWFKRQLFGEKSEKRPLGEPVNESQLWLGEQFVKPAETEPAKVTIKEHEKRKSTKVKLDGAVEENGLRFDATVPLRVIELANPEIAGLKEDEYKVIGEKVTHRLAQRPSSYEVLKYVRKVVKLKADQSLVCAEAPKAVLEKSFADVSLLAGSVVDKFMYHLPLYRQHQRMLQSGVMVSRATLTNYVHSAGDLLRPIYQAVVDSILESKMLIMDETPIKAGVKITENGKRMMQQGYFWPMYGDRDEVAFPFQASRAGKYAREVLGNYEGVLLSDGYKVYERLSEMSKGVVHAQCWVHTRRNFINAEGVEPVLCAKALGYIAELYRHEKVIRERKLDSERKQTYRAMHSKPIVDAFFSWLNETFLANSLLPSSPFTKAANYALNREQALKVFLQYPDVPLDTNEVERQIRPVAIGRKNYMFCWTEVGAEYAGVFYTLVSSCRLQGINPYTYLVDVLQRIDTHPKSQLGLLIPRLWKENFASNPMVSDLQRFHPANCEREAVKMVAL